MESFIFDVLGLVIRWLHIITGIAWIGASFYFIWLDNSLEEPPGWKNDMGIKGDLWSFHGGGIYEVAKYKVGPEKMPHHLHWFYWEAYSTWITGMLLAFVVYYFQSNSYLVNPEGWIQNSYVAIAESLIFLASGVLAYEGLMKAGLNKQPVLFIAALILLLALASWLAVHLFSSRAAYLHIGMLIGTVMVANVFLGIIPPQRDFVKAIDAGIPPDASALAGAKTRSTHNNYFTLPVLFCMISNHYSFLYGHRYNWLILVCIILITAAARHYFNLAHKRIFKPQIIAICAALFLALMGALAWDKNQTSKALNEIQVSELEAMTLVNAHCTNCHAETPTFAGFSAPPLGIILTSPDELKDLWWLMPGDTDYL